MIALVGGFVYPALVQWAVVRPNQGEREALYIARNVEATRRALGIDDVEVQRRCSSSGSSTDEVAGDVEPIRNVRLLNPTQMLSRFTFDRGEEAGLVDRRPRRRPLRDRRRHARAGADRRPRARHRQHPQQELAGRAPRVDAWMRAGDGAGQPGHHAGPAAVPATSTSTDPSSTSAPRSAATPSPAPTWPRTRAGPAEHVLGHVRRRGSPASLAESASRSPSSTTTCSARARSTTTRRCCGCDRSRTGSRSSLRSCTSTVIRIRSSSTAACNG